MAGQIKDEERDNFCRVGQAVVDTCTNICRGALANYIPPSDLSRKVKSSYHFWKSLRNDQKQLVLSSANGYKEFDISLSYTILRNVCTGFAAPNQGWGKQPHLSDTGFADDLERIRILRNETYAHLPQASISNSDYQVIWQELKDICTRMKIHLNNDYPAELQKLESYKMADWKELIEMIERNKERDKKIEEYGKQVERVETHCKDLKNAIEKTVVDVAECSKQTEANKRKLETHEDIIKTHHAKISKLEEQSIGKFGSNKSDVNIQRVKDRLFKISQGLKVQVSPLQKMGGYPLELMYTKVMIKENKYYEMQKMNEERQREKNIESIRDIFYKDNEPAQRVFLLGKAARGKTVFCEWLLKSWINVKQSDDSQIDKYTESLKEFDFVFLIKFRSVKPSLSDVVDMICYDNFKYEQGCHDTVRHVLESDEYRCLVILDGLDEWRPNISAKEKLDHRHIPNIEKVSNCTFLISTRPWKFDLISRSLCIDDHVTEIQGLNGDGIREVTKSVLINHYNIDMQSIEFQDKLEEVMSSYRTHKSFMQIPLLTVVVIQCCIDEKEAGKSLTSFYMTLIELLIKRYLQKVDLSHEKMDEICKKDLTISTTEIIRRYQTVSRFINVLSGLGNVAYGDLINSAEREIERRQNEEMTSSPDTDDDYESISSLDTDEWDELHYENYGYYKEDIQSFVFQRESLVEKIGEENLNFALDVGILSMCESPGTHTEENVSVQFLHKMIQELLAALNIVTQEHKMKEFCIDLTNVSMTLEFSNVIAFICGLSPSMGNELTQHMVNLMDRDTCVSPYRESYSEPGYQLPAGMFYCQLQAYKELRYSETLHIAKEKPEIILFSDVEIDKNMTLSGVKSSEKLLTDKDVRINNISIYCIRGLKQNDPDVPVYLYPTPCFYLEEPSLFMCQNRLLRSVEIDGTCHCNEMYFNDPRPNCISNRLRMDLRTTKFHSREVGSNPANAIILPLSYMKELHKVYLCGIQLYNSPVVPFLTHNPQMKFLVIVKTTIYNDELGSNTPENLAPFMSHMPRLDSLFIKEVTVYIHVRVPLCSYLPVLHTLHLTDVKVHTKGEGFSAPLLSNMPKLQSLILKAVSVFKNDNNSKSDTALLIFNMPNLQSLELRDVNLGTRIVGLTSEMTHTDTIILHDVKMSKRAWKNFVESLKSIKQDKKIELTTCNIDPDSKVFFSKLLQCQEFST